MEKLRRPFQGVSNIVRFNWHFYVVAIAFISFLFLITIYSSDTIKLVIYYGISLLSISIAISLLVSLYVYDLSGLYRLDWIETDNSECLIVNINAGFDETSILLKGKFKNVRLEVLDFYNPKVHTEVSIKRARKAYPPFPNTKQVETIRLPLDTNSVDKVFVILAAHEIRDEAERILFFKELNRILKVNGQIIITEHLRDIPNLIAYNIGFLHFFSKKSWLRTFKMSGFAVKREIKLTALISTFILTKNGNTF